MRLRCLRCAAVCRAAPGRAVQRRAGMLCRAPWNQLAIPLPVHVQVTHILDRHNIHHQTFYRVAPDPTLACIEDGLSEVRGGQADGGTREQAAWLISPSRPAPSRQEPVPSARPLPSTLPADHSLRIPYLSACQQMRESRPCPLHAPATCLPTTTACTLLPACLQLREFRPDVIIALGGGSPMDAAKVG